MRGYYNHGWSSIICPFCFYFKIKEKITGKDCSYNDANCEDGE